MTEAARSVCTVQLGPFPLRVTPELIFDVYREELEPTDGFHPRPHGDQPILAGLVDVEAAAVLFLLLFLLAFQH